MEHFIHSCELYWGIYYNIVNIHTIQITFSFGHSTINTNWESCKFNQLYEADIHVQTLTMTMCEQSLSTTCINSIQVQSKGPMRETKQRRAPGCSLPHRFHC